MDLSKLPKLSQRPVERPVDLGKSVEPVPVDDMPVTPPPAGRELPPPPRRAEPHPAANPYAPGRIGFVETWMCVGIGAFILLYQPQFLQWASWKVFHTNFNQFVFEDGRIDPYSGRPEFLSDLGPTLLGVALIIDGLLFLTRRKAAVTLALFITLLSTGYNLWYVIHSVKENDLPVLSCLAVLFGGMMLGTQWIAFKSFGGTAAPGAAASP